LDLSNGRRAEEVCRCPGYVIRRTSFLTSLRNARRKRAHRSTCGQAKALTAGHGVVRKEASSREKEARATEAGKQQRTRWGEGVTLAAKMIEMLPRSAASKRSAAPADVRKPCLPSGFVRVLPVASCTLPVPAL
ncbi:hypothetical protein KCU68_g6, partial [Aureobasidium melanogenum]